MNNDKAIADLMRCWNLIKATTVQGFDPISKNSGLLFKNHKTADFAFIADSDVKAIEEALTAAQSAPVVDVEALKRELSVLNPYTGEAKTILGGWSNAIIDHLHKSGFLKTPSVQDDYKTRHAGAIDEMDDQVLDRIYANKSPPPVADLAALEMARKWLDGLCGCDECYESHPEKKTIRALLDNAIAAQKDGV